MKFMYVKAHQLMVRFINLFVRDHLKVSEPGVVLSEDVDNVVKTIKQIRFKLRSSKARAWERDDFLTFVVPKSFVMSPSRIRLDDSFGDEYTILSVPDQGLI